MANKFLIIGAFLAFLAVAIGAFGAHGLKPFLSPQMFTVFETGVRYHMYHSLGVLISGWAWVSWSNPLFRYAALAFMLGILFFSGSLYVLSLTGVRWFGAITPIGGLLFLIGWVLLGIGFWKSAPRRSP
jgi:uncharacterized membrane protein YgdD (TMEM256/DUF423 family)